MSSRAPKRRELLSVRDVAANLPEGRGAASSIHAWMATGRLPSVKVGRGRYVKRGDLAAFLGLDVDQLIEAADIEAAQPRGPKAA